jgi:hypothetical protein
MASNLGPAAVTTQMKYSAPNPAAGGGLNLFSLALLAGAAYLIVTPTGRTDVSNFLSSVAGKLGGGSPVGG